MTIGKCLGLPFTIVAAALMLTSISFFTEKLIISSVFDPICCSIGSGFEDVYVRPLVSGCNTCQ